MRRSPRFAGTQMGLEAASMIGERIAERLIGNCLNLAAVAFGFSLFLSRHLLGSRTGLEYSLEVD